MAAEIPNECDKVVNFIANSFSTSYTVLSNSGNDQYYIANLFPSLILNDKKDNKPRFIIEVRRNGNIAQCIQQWKNVPNIPATLYIVVPQDELTNAKTIAQVVGLTVRFGYYTIDKEGGNITVKYE